jgi:hypothetical protein
MADERHPVEDVLRVGDAGRNLIGGTILLAVGIAFVVMGNTAGRLIGSALLAILVVPAIRATHKHFAKPS